MRSRVQIACVLANFSPSMTIQLSDNPKATILTALEQAEALSRALIASGELPLEQEGSRP